MKSSWLLLSSLLSLVRAAPEQKRQTLTYTATSTVVPTVTVTGHTTVYTSVTYTKPFYLPACDYVYTGTVTTTYTSARTVTTTVKPSSVIRSPTVKGFTPIKRESVYVDKIVITKVTTTSATTVTYDPSPTTSPGQLVFAYLGVTTTGTCTGNTYVVETTSIIYTATATPSVYTKYDACKPNNFASRIPTGEIIDSVSQYEDTDYQAYDTADAEECCAICQGTPLCFGGSWENKPFFGSCFIFLDNKNNASEVCDGSVGGLGFFANDPGYTDSAPPDFNYANTVFNGPCGQMTWTFNSDTYFQ